MNTSQPNPGERVRDVHVTHTTLAVDLVDGRTITVPLAWYPRLLDASMSNYPTGKSVAPDTASTGPTLTRILAPKVSCAARRTPNKADPPRSQRKLEG